MIKWLAIDPGATIGWAFGWANLHNDPGVHVEVCGRVDPLHLNDLQPMIEVADAVAIERYTPRHKHLSGDSTIAVSTGVKIAVMAEDAGKPVCWQTASAAKGVITNQKLKAMNLWAPSPHIRDAIRHLVIATRTRKG